MIVDVLDYRKWNRKVKRQEELEPANKNDILMKIDRLYCCYQTINGCNNIMVFSEKHDIRNIKRMYMFITILYYIYKVKYITVSGSLKRYGFLEKLFPENVVRDPLIKNRRVLYVKLNDEVMEKLRREIVK